MHEKDPLPDEFSSIEEIQDFWDHHSTADYADEMVAVEVELSDPLRAKVESRKLVRLLGLSPRQVAMIEELAERQHTGIRELIARWVREHLQEPSTV